MNSKSIRILVLGGGLLCLILGFGLSSCGTISAGHRGVLLQFNATTGEIKKEGFYFKIPIVEKVIPMDCRILKEQVSTSCASKDLQIVTTIVALNISIDPEKCIEIYKTIGIDYLNKIVGPSLQEGIKAIISKYTAEELVIKREDVRTKILELMQEKLKEKGFIIQAVNIVNFDFSRTFNESIEAKVTAEQTALAAKNKLAQVEYEAQQKIAEAEGKAEAMTLESQSLVQNPNILTLRAIEKWDGKMPLYMGNSNAVPFLNFGQIKNDKQ